MEKNDYLTTKELADILGISRIAVFNKIKKGQIKAQKVGRNYIIFKKDLKGILTPELTEDMKKEIDEGVVKTVEEYGETLKMLGKE